MGLRTASARHPHVEVMAPALTETNQPPAYTLDKHAVSPASGKQPQRCDVGGCVRKASPPSPSPPLPAMSSNADDESKSNGGLHVDMEHLLADDLMDVLRTSGDEQIMFGDDLFSVMNVSIDEQQLVEQQLAEAEQVHARLERRLDFLLRRARKTQVRRTGAHVGAEVAGVFEHVQRRMKSESDAGSKNLLKKLANVGMATTTMAAAKAKTKYFGAGSGDAGRVTPAAPFVLPVWPAGEKQELQAVAGHLDSQLRLLQEEVDSEATVSSSGGESCDEAETYNNAQQQYLPMNKRAAWKYALDRSSVSSRWAWLQSQIADLEYKIRTFGDRAKTLRQAKEPVKLGGANPPHIPEMSTCVNGYRGPLPGASTIRNGETLSASASPKMAAMDFQCARTRPLVGFRKRQLLHLTGLHTISKQAARPTTVCCGCKSLDAVCALCTGRADPTNPRDHDQYLSRSEVVALLDPSYHPVISLNQDMSASIHMDALMQTADWQQKSLRTNVKVPKHKAERVDKGGASGSGIADRPRKNTEHRKYTRLIKTSTANALSAKIKNRHRGRKTSRPGAINRLKKRARMSSAQSLGSDGADDEMEALMAFHNGGRFDSPSSSPLQSAIAGYHKRVALRGDSYALDNIVMPQHVASSTMNEKLPVKEILTPKWRTIHFEPLVSHQQSGKHNAKNNGVVEPSQDDEDYKLGLPDVTSSFILARHEICEQEERKKFLNFMKHPLGFSRSRANRRTYSHAESSGANTPDPSSPAPPSLCDKESDPLNTATTIASPPATPLREESAASVPSVAILRRRTCSQANRISREHKDELIRTCVEEMLQPEVAPYDRCQFPLVDEERFQCAQPEQKYVEPLTTLLPSHYKIKDEHERDSESTESAFGDDDPNDPEWSGEMKERCVRVR